jgi:hypothetical protein
MNKEIVFRKAIRWAKKGSEKTFEQIIRQSRISLTYCDKRSVNMNYKDQMVMVYHRDYLVFIGS